MKKLGSLNKAAAWLIAAAMVLIAVFGIGGLKLSSKYNKAEKTFNKTCGASDALGNTFKSDYAAALGFARQVESCAAEVLGSGSSISRGLTSAISEAESCADNYLKAFETAGALDAAVTGAYSAIGKADPAAAESISGAYANFLSAYNIMVNVYSGAYNQYIEARNDLSGGFPTSVIKSLWCLG